MKLSLVILTRNEFQGLKALIGRIPKTSVEEILAVDFESTDGTLELLRSEGIRVIQQRTPGRGEAFRLAFQESTGDALIFFSPDGNETPEDIPRFRTFLEQGFDIVVANRMSDGGRNEEDDKLLPLRKWANLSFSLIANILWNRGTYVHDTINGFRAIRREAWTALNPNGAGYTIEYQTTIRAFKKQLRIAEFPTCESPRIEERVGSPSLPTGLAFLRLLLSELFPQLKPSSPK